MEQTLMFGPSFKGLFYWVIYDVYWSTLLMPDYGCSLHQRKVVGTVVFQKDVIFWNNLPWNSYLHLNFRSRSRRATSFKHVDNFLRGLCFVFSVHCDPLADFVEKFGNLLHVVGDGNFVILRLVLIRRRDPVIRGYFTFLDQIDLIGHDNNRSLVSIQDFDLTNDGFDTF